MQKPDSQMKDFISGSILVHTAYNTARPETVMFLLLLRTQQQKSDLIIKHRLLEVGLQESTPHLSQYDSYWFKFSENTISQQYYIQYRPM